MVGLGLSNFLNHAWDENFKLVLFQFIGVYVTLLSEKARN